MKTIITTTMISLFSYLAFAGEDSTVVIKTSAQCESCQKRIEEGLAFEKGVKSVKLDPDTKAVTIVYDPKKTTPEKLRVAITKLGYDADDMPAEEKAYKKLPDCCKKPGN